MINYSKRTFRWLAALLAVVLLIQTPAAYAESLSELKEKQKQLEEKTNQLNDSIKEKTSEIGTIETEQSKLLNQISDLSEKIDKTNSDIENVSSEITKANDEIEDLNESIAKLEKKIEERNVLLQERARAIQVSGTVSYVDVLLGSNSFVDFIDRFSAVTSILNADKQIMREQKDDKNKLEDDKIVLENKKKELEDNQAQLVTLKKSLDSQKSEVRTLVTKLEAEQEKLTSEKQLLEEEYSEALSISKDNDKAIEAEQARLAEVARKKAEADAKAKQNAPNNANAGSASSSTPAVSAGTWTKPTNGRLTSPFGWRNLGFGREFHYGIDLANSVGTPVVAANSGVVSYAGSLSSYGNVIMITHYVNGSVWTTVYAHLSAIQVSKGQEVDKGQKIGLMGNTGRSYGSHLHFEIHNGPWVSGRPNAQNPLNYINM